MNESDIIPFHSSPPPGERALVLAPHPDDESLGCGGTIRLLLKSGKKVKVVFLTSGDKADPDNPKSKIAHRAAHITAYSLMREEEAKKALKVLGVSDFEFLRFPDRGLYENYDDALKSVMSVVDVFSPDAIYAPSMVEMNPDHRAAAALAIEMQKKISPLAVVFYEVTMPIRPNMLVDISSVYKKKKRAVEKHRSQMRLRDYLHYITAMNAFRALTVIGAKYVEAFWRIEEPISGEEITKWLSFQTLPEQASLQNRHSMMQRTDNCSERCRVIQP